MPFSRVIEVEPATKKIVWEYREKRESDFLVREFQMRSGYQMVTRWSAKAISAGCSRSLPVENWSGSTLIPILKDRQMRKRIEYSARTDTVQRRSPEQERWQVLCELCSGEERGNG